jgi:hypothetical protein
MFLHSNRRHHHFRECATFRRLALERIEDRLLLAGVVQTGMESQVVNLQAIVASDSDCITINNGNASPTGTALIGNTAQTALSTNSCIDNIGIVAQPSGIFGRKYWNDYASSDGTQLIRIGVLDLPTSPNPPLNSPVAKTPGQEPIDIAVVYQAPAATTADSPLPERGVASPIVGTKPPASKPLENSIPKTGVEGIRGKAQIFDLATTPGGESAPDVFQVSNLTDKPVGVEGKFTAVRLASVSLPIRDNAATSESAAARNDAGNTSFNASKAEPGQEADESTPSPAEQTHHHVVPPADAVSPTTGQAASMAQANCDAPAPAETHAQRVESTDTAQASRRAVFADMAKNDSDPRYLPIFPPEHRQTELIGLAIAAVAGQPLMQKWRRRFAKGALDIDDQMLPR